ncbi:MAG: hypothetical protein R6W31_02745 [Bacteroidales bacterium]
MNKRIAPTVILILLIFFILVQAGVLIFAFKQEGIGLAWRIILALVPLGIIIALVTVYIERIREIGQEENDDLSQY